MPRIVGLDTGPIVALFNRTDHYHAQAIAFFSRAQFRFFTSLAVITEAVHLLGFHREPPRDLLRWIRVGALGVVAQHPDDWDRILELFEKYADLPVDFADASLIAICERLGTREIATIDSDFRIYRYRNRQAFDNVFLDGG